MAVPEDKSIFYNPLSPGEIRLLILKPSSDWNAGIHCMLKTRSLTDRNLSYTALSYRWGEPALTPSISLDNKPFPTSLTTRNLVAALRHFRHPTQSVTLWVDAICIDQKHQFESRQQIQHMRQIYSTAKETWVWLGSAADRSGDAIDLIEELSGLSYEDCDLIKERRLIALDDFFAREYWYRVWVIQEVAVSNNLKLFCGKRQFSWDSLYTAAIFFNKHAEIDTIIHKQRSDQSLRSDTNHFRAGIQRIISIQSVRNDCMRPRRDIVAEPSDSLLFLLSSHRSTQATEPNDKYLAIAGLAENQDHDYASLFPPLSLSTTRDVFLWGAEQITRQQHQAGELALDFLDTAGLSENQLVRDNWPSWVPDWSNRHPRLPLLYWQLQKREGGMEQVKASNRDITPVPGGATFWIDQRKRQLKALGFTLDFVTEVGDSQRSSRDKQVPKEKTDAKGAQTLHIPSYGGQQAEEVIWRTFVLDRNQRGQKAPSDWGDIFFHLSQHMNWYDQNLHLKIQNQSFEEIRTKQLETPYVRPTEYETLPNLQTAMTVALGNRRLATSQNGFLSMAPWDTEPGDILAILYDCNAPVVLRQIGGGEYRFIGTCYVHGIMQGEAAVGLSNEARVAEAFHLR